MYAKIKPTGNIHEVLRYNEAKLKKGKAECLVSENFVKDLWQLTERDKLDRLLQRTSLNEFTDKNIFHISVNFSPEEKISDEKMRMLAKRYMEGIGFERQPYLVYRHYDSGHPHFHIVTTNILASGKRIKTNKSELR